MANNQEEQTLTSKDYREMLENLKKELEALGKLVERKFISIMTKVKNAFRDNCRAFVTDVLDSFVVDTSAKLKEMAGIVGGDLALALYGVQQDLYSLKVALIQAAAPLAQALIPLLRQAIAALTGFAQSVGTALRSLFGCGEAADSYAGSAQAALAATQALKRSLAGFDQLERLDSNSVSGFFAPDVGEIAPQWQAFAGWLTQLFEPFKSFDMGPAIAGFQELRLALEPITRTLFEGLEWAWHNLLVPLAQWAAEDFLPVFLELLTQALQTLDKTIQELKPAFIWLWENFLEPMSRWYAEQLIADVKAMTENFRSFSAWIESAAPTINSFIAILDNAGITMQGLNGDGEQLKNMAQKLAVAFNLFGAMTQQVNPGLAAMLTAIGLLLPEVDSLSGSWGSLTGSAESAWKGLKEIWGNLTGWFTQQVSRPMEQNSKSAANGIIGVFNGMLSSISGAFNGLSQAVNSIRFTVPDWVPGVGGKSLGFNLPGVNMPTIPQLAKGAVLPANKPFLAVVGDQKHGTNVEAPLSTIQEAVLLALEDRLDGVMAGFNAVTQRQEQILQAIFTLDVSDGALAAAVQRHQQKLLAVTGGCI